MTTTNNPANPLRNGAIFTKNGETRTIQFVSLPNASQVTYTKGKGTATYTVKGRTFRRWLGC
jgi:hypothetical protein